MTIDQMRTAYMYLITARAILSWKVCHPADIRIAAKYIKRAAEAVR